MTKSSNLPGPDLSFFPIPTSNPVIRHYTKGQVRSDYITYVNSNGQYRQYHRLDGPAVISANGAQYWYKNGNLHREDGPALIYPDGTQKWYKHGQYHREDGPAVIYPDGIQYWYKNGKYHREDGPAVIWSNGAQKWYKEGVQYDPNS